MNEFQNNLGNYEADRQDSNPNTPDRKEDGLDDNPMRTVSVEGIDLNVNEESFMTVGGFAFPPPPIKDIEVGDTESLTKRQRRELATRVKVNEWRRKAQADESARREEMVRAYTGGLLGSTLQEAGLFGEDADRAIEEFIEQAAAAFAERERERELREAEAQQDGGGSPIRSDDL